MSNKAAVAERRFSEPSLVPTHPDGLEELEEMNGRVRSLWAPPPNITVSEWARKNRILPKGTTSRPGEFIPEKFQVEMMDAILDPKVHQIVVKKSTQIGYSDAVLNNIIGYFIDVDPKPQMMVQPREDDATDYGKKRITPMIQSCPSLRSKVRESKSRDGGNTLRLKEYPGGFVKLTGSVSARGLRSDPVPVVLFDEIDGYELDVDGEGDPIEIGTRRTDGYSDWKVIKGSTPAKPKGFSRVEQAYEESDQRKFYVPCPHCGHEQFLRWSDPDPTDTQEKRRIYRLIYQVDADMQVIKSSVVYLCEGCKQGISERYKKQMLDAGRWIAKFPDRPIVGFDINALYSPWRENWHELAQEWVKAVKSKDAEKLKAFVNLRLAEAYEESGSQIAEGSLKARLEQYPPIAGSEDPCDVPSGVGVLTASVDVQDDRLEVAVKGWGKGEESWLIAYQQFFGNPGLPQVWDDVDEFLKTEFRHESGRRVGISRTFIDSGGHHTDSVYRFTKTRSVRGIFAIRGASESGKEILGKWTLNNELRVRLYTLGVDTAKDRVFARLQIPAAGAGFVHLPDWTTEEYLEQLTAEKRVIRYKKGRGMVSEYIKKRDRNEALDLEVYALAALYSLGIQKLKQLGEIAEALAEPIGTPTGESRPADEGQNTGEGEGNRGETGRSWGSASGSKWVNGWRY